MKNQNYFFRNPVAAGVVVFLVLLLLTQSLSLQRYLLNLSESKKENTEELNRVVDQLQFNLNFALSTTKTLSFLVENYGTPKDFDTIAKKLMEANTTIDAIQLLENGVITEMYPLQGNEVVIGYNVVADPTRGTEVLMAGQKGEMYFGGPFELRQGGMGVVGRMPIKMETDSLAFAAVVIRLEKLLEVSGMSKGNERFHYQLSKINPDTNIKEYFIESDIDFTESQVATLKVPLGEWQLYVKETQANYYEGLLPLALLGFMLSFFGGSLTLFILRRPSILAKQVDKQSRTILENNRRFQALVENSLDAVAILAPDGSNKYVSPSIVTVLGYTVEESMMTNLFDILHDDDKPVVTEEIQYVLENPGKPSGHVSKIKHKNGSWRWIESSITNLLDDPAVNGIVNNFRDITEKKESEDIILKEKELSEAIINSLPGIFYMFNSEGQFLLWNKNFEIITEYSAIEIEQMNLQSLFEGEEIAYISERIQETFEKGVSFAEAYLVTKSQKKIYYFFTGNIIEYKGQKCVLGTGIDTSKRREAELELKRSEEQLLSIFNNSISAVILMDSNGDIKSWNATAEEMFGWKAHEVIDKPMHHFIMPEWYVDAHVKGVEHYLKTGEGPIINSNIELTAINRDEKEFDISLGVTKVQIRGKEFFIGFINDISGRKQAERIKEYEDQKREAMINSTSDLIWSVSDKMTLIAANNPFKAIFKKYAGKEIFEGETVLPKENLEEAYLLFWENLYRRALKGEQFTQENIIPATKNQEEQTLETSFNPIYVNEKIIGVACSSRNISDRIKIQQEIKEYNEKLLTAQEIAQLGYWEHVLGENDVYWSNQVYEIWEEDPLTFEINMENFFTSVHPDDREKFNLYKNKPVDHIDTQDIEYRIITRKGNLKWIHQYGKRVVDEGLNKTTFKGTLREITLNKLQQEAIKDYNLKLQTAQKIAKLGYWEFDYKKDTLTWSDQVYTIWEVPKNSFNVSFDNFFETIHPDDKELFLQHQKMVLNEKDKPLEIEHRIILRNGKIKWVLQRGKLLKDDTGNFDVFEGTVQDITSQKQTETELREQNHFIKAALDNLPIGIAVNDMNTGEATLMNRRFTQIYGWPKKELIDIQNFYKKVYPDATYREEMKSQILSDINSKNPKRMNWEGVKITTKKGENKIINAKNIPLYEQGLMISTVLDVTEKALAEQQLAMSNERYEYVTKATFDAIWDWDLVQDSIFWGEGYETIFGYNTGETKPDLWYKNIHPNDLERIKESVKKLIEGFELNWQEEYRFKHTNGTYRYVKDRGIVLRNIERKAIRFIGAMQDITSQKEYEQKLLDVNQKLRNLSAHLQEAREEERIAIAREIHDELGQQLTGIKLDVSWLKNKFDSSFPENKERTKKLIENINKTINDVRKIASHLRPGVLDDLGLEAAIEWQSQLFEDQTGLECELKFESSISNFGKEINTALYRIYQETLTNIMRHAKATKVFTHLYTTDSCLILKVKDNGVGISDSSKNNTFSLGITGMRERALMINGSLRIQKLNEGGTLVEVSIPL